jgi:hypothetical protein
VHAGAILTAACTTSHPDTCASTMRHSILSVDHARSLPRSHAPPTARQAHMAALQAGRAPSGRRPRRRGRQGHARDKQELQHILRDHQHVHDLGHRRAQGSGVGFPLACLNQSKSNQWVGCDRAPIARKVRRLHEHLQARPKHKGLGTCVLSFFQIMHLIKPGVAGALGWPLGASALGSEAGPRAWWLCPTRS